MMKFIIERRAYKFVIQRFMRSTLTLPLRLKISTLKNVSMTKEWSHLPERHVLNVNQATSNV
jgi:hypothetical protein